MNYTLHAHPATRDFKISRVYGDVWLKIGDCYFYLAGKAAWPDDVDAALAARIIEAIEPGSTMPEISA